MTPMDIKIVKYPDPILRRVARAVTEQEMTEGKIEGVSLDELVARMFDLMHESKGIGLAAPQVGRSWRLFVAETEDRREKYAVVNPVLLTKIGSEIFEEGCLSFPGLNGRVKRCSSVVLAGFNWRGEPVEYSATGMLARVFQHECDHLDGVLFIDRLGSAKRLFLRRDLRHLEDEYRRSTAGAAAR